MTRRRRAISLVFVLVLAACGRSGPSVTQRAAEAPPAFDPATASYKIIPPTDLPPEGTRSTFDYVIKDNKSLPFPFEKLVDLIASYDVDGKKPTTVLIPDGRSLLKAHANFKQPRIIVAADPHQPASDGDLGLNLRGRLFLGYVEAANEIEVISYNEQAGRFEFQLVKDYRQGGQPRIVYAKRAICTTCHAGAAPIFPVRPWQETNGQPDITAKILEARGEKAGGAYHGAPLSNTLSAPETVNEMVDVAGTFPATQRVWIDGCGTDPEKGLRCRRLMLDQALRYLMNPGSFSTDTAEYRELQQLQQAAWPKRDIILASGNLLNRNPFVDRPDRTMWQWMLSLLPQRKPGEVDANAKVSDFDKLPPLRMELDPLTPRAPKEVLKPGSETAIAGIAQMFSPNDKRLLEKASDYEPARLQKAVLSDHLDTALGAAPFRRVAVTQALLAALGPRTVPAYCCATAEGMSAPVTEGAKPLAISSGSVLKTFEHYCFGCHRGNPNAKLNFMDGKDEAEVLAHIKDTSAIRDVLDYDRFLGTDKENKLMPPKNSWQRAALDESRAAKKDDVKKMRETVPGLFDF